jgi:hypothetical protein
LFSSPYGVETTNGRSKALQDNGQGTTVLSVRSALSKQRTGGLVFKFALICLPLDYSPLMCVKYFLFALFVGSVSHPKPI